MAKIDYPTVFAELLAPYLEAGRQADPAALFLDQRLDGASDKAKRGQLKKFISANVDFAESVEGLLPSADTIIQRAQLKLGEAVCEANVVAANRICAQIVERVTKPAFTRFVRKAMGERIKDGLLTIEVDDLLRFLSAEYEDFRVGAGNGLVSVAGTLNERLLVWCLKERGLEQGTDFTVTGKKSDGDIVLHTQAGSKKNLGVEIKSYHARERLLRGLQDVQQPKAGAGFFIDADEFNKKRTPDLLATNSAAIYMPRETLESVSANSRAMTTNERIALGQPVYRPLEQFATDMASYCRNGTLPEFKI